MSKTVVQKEILYRNWLYHVPGIGKVKLGAISKVFGSCEAFCGLLPKEREEVLKAYIEKATEEDLVSLNAGDLRKIEAFRDKWTPEGLWEEIFSRGIRVLSPEMEEYPGRLRSIADRPELLYCLKGEAEEEKIFEAKRPVIAVIGSRICSEYGRMIAKRIGRLCGEMDMELVSGMAVGIDGISQKAAWEAGGMVTAVLGSGVDVCYPLENEELYVNLTKRGRILSELPTGTRPVAGNFPLRNRIISGLADTLIVVDAREKSGTMITVDMALEQGRQVYIIPGRLSDPLSAGCNRLISQGAEIIWNLSETMEHIYGEYGGDFDAYVNRSPEAFIFAALDFYPESVQQIYEKVSGKCGITLPALQTKLVEMELMGRVKEEGGHFYRKEE